MYGSNQQVCSRLEAVVAGRLRRIPVAAAVAGPVPHTHCCELMVSGLNQVVLVHLPVRMLLMHVIEHRVDDDAHAVARARAARAS